MLLIQDVGDCLKLLLRAEDDSKAADEASTSLVRSSQPTTALAVVQDFDPKAAALLLEEEVREAVVGTVGTAVGKIAPYNICVYLVLPFLAACHMIPSIKIWFFGRALQVLWNYKH